MQSLKIENVGLLAAGNAVIGGTVSVIGGGKFANGAVTGAFTMLFNHLAHEVEQEQQNKLLTRKIGQAALAERQRNLKNNHNMTLPYPEMDPEINYDITVPGTSGYIKDASIDIGDKSVSADIYYAPSKNNIVRSFGGPRNQPASIPMTSIKGYLVYLHNSRNWNVVTLLFSDQSNYNSFKNYIYGK